MRVFSNGFVSSPARGAAVLSCLTVLTAVTACAAAPGRFLRGDVTLQQGEDAFEVALQWEPAAGASEYVVTVVGRSDEPPLVRRTSENRLVLEGVAPERQFLWRVEAVGPGGGTTASADGPGEFATPAILERAPTVVVPRAAGPVTLDGEIGEDEWSAATEIALRWRALGAVETETPLVRLQYDDENLYFLCRSWTPEGRAVEAPDREHDGDVWADDAFEIFLLPAGQERHMQFIASASACRSEGIGRAQDWTVPWSAAAKTHRDEQGRNAIVIEIAIPWTSLGGKFEPGVKQGFNVVADFSPQVIIRSFSVGSGYNLHDKRTFGTLMLAP